MKITKIEPIVLSAPLKEPWPIGTAVLTATSATLVRADTDEGITGVGECLVRLAPEAAAAVVDRILKPVVLGQDPFNVELLWDRMYRLMRDRGHSKGFVLEAISGVDIALWDIIGKALGQPIHRVLGSYGRTHLPVYASSLMFRPVDTLVREAQDLVSRGFRALKLKVGQGAEIDVRNVREIRRALSDDTRLMVDANCAFDTLSAMEIGRQFESEGVYWFEEPVPPENLAGYEKLARSLDMAVAGGESEFTHWAFKELFIRNAVDIVQPDIARVGGFTEARKIAALASAFDVPVAPHAGASAAVAIAASLQWAAALPNLLTFEHMVAPNPLRDELLVEPLPTMEGGYVRVPEKPGLGVELDPQALARFRVA